MHRAYAVGLRSYLILGAVCCVFFMACAVGAFLARQYWPILVFGFFVLMGVYLLMSAGNYEFSESCVSHRNAFGHFRMRWQDVREVELGPQGSIVLHGGEKRLIVAPPSAWSGAGKMEAFDLMRRKLDAPGVRSYPGNFADYKIHRNARV
ncbi:hypothetical protein [Pseudoxanthomonas putridarboris]|uniref:PH domain-containing protein n=1 Tax=Pseudoxanthomonas putridarboris TaxID=752605 RepID=A0ABU9J5S8_9GAMM